MKYERKKLELFLSRMMMDKGLDFVSLYFDEGLESSICDFGLLNFYEDYGEDCLMGEDLKKKFRDLVDGDVIKNFDKIVDWVEEKYLDGILERDFICEEVDEYEG
jgi:hypothetical protein